jgi:hypothetical protein
MKKASDLGLHDTDLIAACVKVFIDAGWGAAEKALTKAAKMSEEKSFK